jgi:hypothetical protein
MSTAHEHWAQSPQWLRRLTVFAAAPAFIGFCALVFSGAMFEHPFLVGMFFGICFAVAAVHTGLMWWKLWRDGG